MSRRNSHTSKSNSLSLFSKGYWANLISKFNLLTYTRMCAKKHWHFLNLMTCLQPPNHQILEPTLHSKFRLTENTYWGWSAWLVLAHCCLHTKTNDCSLHTQTWGNMTCQGWQENPEVWKTKEHRSISMLEFLSFAWTYTWANNTCTLTFPEKTGKSFVT